MKTTITILMIAAFFSQTLAAPFRFDMPEHVERLVINKEQPDTPFCRLFDGPSRCVDEPLPIPDQEPWCPYRMCAPSYVPADTCPADKKVQATDKCRAETITRDVYKCDGKAFGHNYVPVGCVVGTPGCHQTPTCSCMKVPGYTSTVLVHVVPFKPDCGTRPPTTAATTLTTTARKTSTFTEH